MTDPKKPRDLQGIPDDVTVRVGNWLLHVSGEHAYVHHADKPGDIHIKAEAEGFLVVVYDDDVEEVQASLYAEYTNLKGEL